jgi:hypothetical protein
MIVQVPTINRWFVVCGLVLFLISINSEAQHNLNSKRTRLGQSSTSNKQKKQQKQQQTVQQFLENLHIQQTITSKASTDQHRQLSNLFLLNDDANVNDKICKRCENIGVKRKKRNLKKSSTPSNKSTSNNTDEAPSPSLNGAIVTGSNTALQVQPLVDIQQCIDDVINWAGQLFQLVLLAFAFGIGAIFYSAGCIISQSCDDSFYDNFNVGVVLFFVVPLLVILLSPLLLIEGVLTCGNPYYTYTIILIVVFVILGGLGEVRVPQSLREYENIGFDKSKNMTTVDTEDLINILKSTILMQGRNGNNRHRSLQQQQQQQQKESDRNSKNTDKFGHQSYQIINVLFQKVTKSTMQFLVNDFDQNYMTSKHSGKCFFFFNSVTPNKSDRTASVYRTSSYILTQKNPFDTP